MTAGPRHPVVRWLLVGVVFAHLITIVDQVIPDGDSDKVRLPTTRWIVDTLHLKQRWNMFKSPGPRGAYIRSLGWTAEGQELELVPDGMPPDGPYFNPLYDRMLKFHSAMRTGDSSKVARRYADWLCADNDVQRVQVVRVLLMRPTPQEQRGHPERTWTETPEVIWEQPCP